jgi:histidinol-phosphate aminotransferase
MAISRRVLLRSIGAAAAGAAAAPAFAGAFTRGAAGGGPLRLDRNENAYGPSSKAIVAMQDAARTAAFRYPEAETAALHDAIARVHHESADRIVLGCGATEILRMAADAFLGPGKTLFTAQPTFDFIGDCARRAGAQVVAVPLSRDHAHDLDAMLARAGSSSGVVYICNPNNPTGTLTSRRDLEAFIRQLPRAMTVIVDEAYHHYAGESPAYASFIDRPTGDDRVIVTRTFSAVYGLAGLRVGYGVAAPEVVKRLSACRLPQSVNVVAASAAVAALDDQEHVRLSVGRNADDRQEFYNQCNARMLRPIDSLANFVMMNTGGPAAEVVDHLRRHNVAIGPPIAGSDKCIRVSLGTPAEMEEFWRVWDLMPSRKMTM